MIKIITDAAEARALRNRDIESYGNYAETVRAILADVAKRGDEALIESGRRFDCPTLDSLAVTEEEIDEAIASLPAEVLDTIKTCADTSVLSPRTMQPATITQSNAKHPTVFQIFIFLLLTRCHHLNIAYRE